MKITSISEEITGDNYLLKFQVEKCGAEENLEIYKIVCLLKKNQKQVDLH